MDGDHGVIEEGRGVRERPGRKWWLRPVERVLAIFAAVMMVVTAVVILVGVSAEREEEALVAEKGGLLADVRGEDTLSQLRVSQAAMEREMEWVRRRLTEGEGVSWVETDLVRAVSEVEAGQWKLKTLAGLLQVQQVRLHSMVIGCQESIAVLLERFDTLDPMGKGN